jgi:hypothetical protein
VRSSPGAGRFSAALETARESISQVPGWAGCPFTTTGQPAARAQTVVRADDADGKGEVAGAKDHDRSDAAAGRGGHRAWAGAALRLGAVDAGLGPGAFADQRGEHAALVDGAAALAGEARHGQGGLGMGALEQGIAEGEDFLGQGFEQEGAGLGAGAAQAVKGAIGSAQRLIGLGGGGLARSEGSMSWFVVGLTAWNGACCGQRFRDPR